MVHLESCSVARSLLGYWVGGRPSAAETRVSARTPRGSAGLPPKKISSELRRCLRQNAQRAALRAAGLATSGNSAGRPGNIRWTLSDSARIRADTRGLRRELAELFAETNVCQKISPNTIVRGGITSAANVLPPRTLPPRTLPPRTFPRVRTRVRNRVRARVRVRVRVRVRDELELGLVLGLWLG